MLMRRGAKALMVSNLALLLVVFPSEGAASTAVKGLNKSNGTILFEFQYFVHHYVEQVS